MARSEHTHTFIVRLWRESREGADAARRWRGSVEAVPSGERRFVDNLAQILEVIGAFLNGRPGADGDGPNRGAG